jgi:hypothetical protein
LHRQASQLFLTHSTPNKNPKRKNRLK